MKTAQLIASIITILGMLLLVVERDGDEEPRRDCIEIAAEVAEECDSTVGSDTAERVAACTARVEFMYYRCTQENASARAPVDTDTDTDTSDPN